jgi:hypothetical protein
MSLKMLADVRKSVVPTAVSLFVRIEDNHWIKDVFGLLKESSDDRWNWIVIDIKF